MHTPPVILYSYDASPYAQKVASALLLKGIQYQRVQVAPVLPRPEISGELGIDYRRIPLLAIGNDVYCDTNLIVSVLESRFPSSQGYGTLFPPGNHGKSTNAGLIKLFSKFYADNGLFGPASFLVPWDKLPEKFVKDRSEFRGSPLNPAALLAARDSAISQLSSHLILIEEHLSDGRKWLFDTTLPGLADISVHFILVWAKSLRTAPALLDGKRFPLTLLWLERTSSFFEAKTKEQGISAVLKGAAAGDAIFASQHEPYTAIGFDVEEGKRLRVQLGDMVHVVPDDTGRNHPTRGKLVALSLSETVLEVKGKRGTLRCHFPRLGYVLAVSNRSKL